jgi:hypothetical protein
VSAIDNLNDSTAAAAPRPVVSINGASFTVNGSDYLVIRSARVGMASAAGKWTTLQAGAGTHAWGPAEEELATGDRVIVIAPGGVNQDQRTLVDPATGISFSSPFPSGYAPPIDLTLSDPDIFPANLVYGIDNGPLVRPFNRAEYYIDNTAGTVPPRCAPTTGVLVKAVVRHDASGSTPDLLPLLDCVADMQVVFGFDMDANPATELVWSGDISTGGSTAVLMRTQLKEVRVHILTQEGQRDPSYTHSVSSITVGSEGAGRSFDLNGVIGSGYTNYRWKVYSIVVKPRNLAN